MSNQENQFEMFEMVLSPGELMWVAGAMGIKGLYLPFDPFAGMLVEEIQHAVDEGQHSLHRRGLLEVKGKQFSLDPVVMGLVQKFSQTKQITSINRIQADTPRESLLLLHEGANLIIRLAGARYEFLLFQEQNGVKAWLQDWVESFAEDLAPGEKALSLSDEWVREFDARISAISFREELPRLDGVKINAALAMTAGNLAAAEAGGKQTVFLANGKHLWEMQFVDGQLSAVPGRLEDLVLKIEEAASR